jgi:hypothetical protein
MRVLHIVICSVVDRHRFDVDPDPTFYFEADPDPTFHFDADPDPDTESTPELFFLLKSMPAYIVFYLLLVSKVS